LNNDLILTLVGWIEEALSSCQRENLSLLDKFRDLEDFDQEKKKEFQDEYEKNSLLIKSTKFVNLFIISRSVYTIMSGAHEIIQREY